MKNHLGEPAQATHQGWRAACKKVCARLGMSPVFEGDKDIAQCYADSKLRVPVGEWDGAEGCQYSTKG